MPVQTYVCDACQYTFDNKEGYHDKAKRKCPSCQKWKLYRCLNVPLLSIRANTSDVKTVEHLGSRNRESMGRYELEAAELKNKRNQTLNKENTPFWRPGRPINKKLAKLTPEKKQKYVADGEI